jgi:hypothetical protein
MDLPGAVDMCALTVTMTWPRGHVKGDPMATASEPIVMIRQIQGFTALLSCLPAGGKARELFSLALACDEGPWLDRIGPPDEPDTDEGMKAWFESLWAQGGLSPEEQKIVDWQKDSDNMSGALAEFKEISAKLTRP